MKGAAQLASPGLTVASDSLVGTEVRDTQGKVIGKISGLMTLQRGQNQEFVVTMQQQYLEQAPSASPGPDRQPERKQQ